MAKPWVFCYGFFMLIVQKLSFARGRVMIFSDLSFQLQDGEILWLVGDNGAGKTTLLKTLLGRLQPTNGAVVLQYQGDELKTTDPDYQASCFYLGHHHSGQYSGQEGGGDLSTLQYLQFVKKLWRGKESIETIAKKLDLQQHLTKKIKNLSSGMQKKLQLAAMVYAATQKPPQKSSQKSSQKLPQKSSQKPPQKSLWLLDEPFTALDKKTKQWLWQWLLARVQGGDKIIFTSHDNIDGDIDKKITAKIKKIYL